ncbi:MAG: dihydroorotate dehydrogenase-like protein [Vulcanimicrobiota bacterium]
MSDLSMSYLGLTLKNPLVASSSPLTQRLEMVKRLEKAGAGAVILHSLFEEQITAHEAASQNIFTSISPDSYRTRPEDYLEYIRRVKAEVSIPVIASLNGISTGGWIVWARRIEEAGADALELNTYFIAANPEQTSARQDDMYVELVRMTQSILSIPVSVKLSPYFSAFSNTARRIVEAGAAGLVLFNRFYQPDIDIESRQIIHRVSLSTSQEILLPLRWIALLYGRVKSDLAVTGGVHNAEDVVKSIMAGASATMMASALIKKGVEHIGTILDALSQWMDAHGVSSLRELQGVMSQQQVDDPAAYERVQYQKTLGAFHM